MVCGSQRSQTASLIYRDLCDRVVGIDVLLQEDVALECVCVCVCDLVALWFVEQCPLCHVELGTEPIMDIVQTIGYVKVGYC